jgi:hypothetical protein
MDCAKGMENRDNNCLRRELDGHDFTCLHEA